MEGGEDAQEYVLRKIQRLFAVAQEVGGELHDHALVLGHELGARRLVVADAPLHQGRFAAVDVEPIGDTSLLH
jgi:hypothetical protein